MTTCTQCENLNCLIKKHSLDNKITAFLGKKHTIKCKKITTIYNGGHTSTWIVFYIQRKGKSC